MLSLVPLLALTFALLKAFGVQNLLQPLIIEKLNVGDGQVAEVILGYINNTQVTKLGAVGLIFLIIAVVSLLTNVEKSFNHAGELKMSDRSCGGLPIICRSFSLARCLSFLLFR